MEISGNSGADERSEQPFHSGDLPFHNPFERTNPRQQGEITVPGQGGDSPMQPGEQTSDVSSEQSAESMSRQPEKIRLNDFMVEHNGFQPEIPLAEQQQAGDYFASAVNDLLLQNIDQVGPNPSPIEIDYVIESEVELDVPIAGHDRSIWATVVKEDRLPAVNNNYHDIESHTRITLHDTFLGHSIFYSSMNNGIVHRREQRPAPLLKPSLVEKLDAMPPTEREAAIRELLDFARNSLKGSNEEKQMGLNDQPIGMREATGLIRFLQQPGVTIRERES